MKDIEYYPWYSPHRIIGYFALVCFIPLGILYALTYILSVPYFITDLIVRDKRYVFMKYMKLK